MNQIPQIRMSPITGEWQCLTRWRKRKGGPPGCIESLEHFNVDDQIKAIIKDALKAHRKKRRKNKNVP